MKYVVKTNWGYFVKDGIFTSKKSLAKKYPIKTIADAMSFALSSQPGCKVATVEELEEVRT